MGKSKCTIDGKPVAGSLSWALTAGTQAFAAVALLTRSDANALVAKGKSTPVTIHAESGGRMTDFKGVYVLHRAPSPSPKFAAVTIADRRWLWPRSFYRRSLNETRKVGTKRLLAPNQFAPFQLDPRFAFKRWSLKDKTAPWTAKDLLEDLRDAIVDFERSEGGGAPKVVLPQIDATAGLPIQNLDLDGGLDEVIARALAYLPGLDVTVDADGTIRFYWTQDRSETAEISAAGDEAQNRGHIEPVSYARTRPRKYRIFFDMEVELKVVANEAASAGTTTDVQRTPDDLYAENVLPIPDPSLAVAGQTLSTGTYVTMSEAFKAWGAVPGLGQPLDFPLVNQAMVPFMSLFNGMEQIGAGVPNVSWAARLGALQSNYRTTFRINPAWTDMIADLRPYRVATLNSQTGTRGDASVFSDFCYMPTGRSLLAERLNSGMVGYGVNVACYPINGQVDAATIAAPADLTIEDAEQGIFSISYHADPSRMYEQALPSQIELVGTNTAPGMLVILGQGGPSPFLESSSGEKSLRNRPIAFNLLGDFDQPCTLTARHALIAILTAVPASPNWKNAMCYVDVFPNEVPPFPGRDECLGPTQEIHVNVETARVAWIESDAAAIKSIFTSTTGKPGDGPFPLARLVSNYDSGGSGAASLVEIARAEAARGWNAERDRSGGSATFGFRGAARVQGAISSVNHELSSDGGLSTRYDLPGRVAPLSLMQYLTAKTLRIIQRIINPGK